jgi:hypothetical protein
MGVLDPAQIHQCDGKGDDCELMYHQPGGTKGLSATLREAKGRTCRVVDYLMRQDVPGLQRTTFKDRCPTGTSKIALVVDPGEDYHYFRQSRLKDGRVIWEHKDGANKVKDFDAEGQPIVNPQTAARDYRPNGSFLNYTDFCGFYCAPRDHPIQLAQGGGAHSREHQLSVAGGAHSRERRSRHRKLVRRIKKTQRRRRRHALLR